MIPYHNNTVFPSMFGVGVVGYSAATQAGLWDGVYTGEVLAAYAPTDENNVSKRYWEYDLRVETQVPDSTATVSSVRGCRAVSGWGTAADRSSWYLRPASRQPDSGQNFADGARVLVVFLAGDPSRGLIIGSPAINDGKEQQIPPDGVHYFTEFNGASLLVDDLGQIRIRFRGQTLRNGDLSEKADADAEGSEIFWSSKGSISLTTAAEKQSLILDHENQEIRLQADTGLKMDVRGGRAVLTSQGLTLGAGGQKLLLGSNYRQAQQALHTKLQTLLASTAGQLQACAGFLTTVAGQHAVPVVGPVTAAPTLAAAAQSLLVAGTQLQAAVTAISEFEAGASQYLSNKNEHD